MLTLPGFLPKSKTLKTKTNQIWDVSDFRGFRVSGFIALWLYSIWLYGFIPHLQCDSGVVMDPLNPRECSGGHTEDKLLLVLKEEVEHMGEVHENGIFHYFNHFQSISH